MAQVTSDILGATRSTGPPPPESSSTGDIKSRRTPLPVPLPVPVRRSRQGPVIGAVLTLLLAVGWYVAAHQALTQGVGRQDVRIVAQAAGVFREYQNVVQAGLKAQAQLISEDPRLKSAMNTAGMDRATIADILTDLQRQTGAQLVVALDPAGRARAVIGERISAGLDLSSSSIVRAAQTSETAVSGFWLISDQLLNVAAVALRFDSQIVAYLLLANRIGSESLENIRKLTDGVAGAIFRADKMILAAPDDAFHRMHLKMVADTAHAGQTVAIHGEATFVGLLDNIGDEVLATRVAWLFPVARSLKDFEGARLLMWVPMIAATLLGCWIAWRNAAKGA